MKELSFEVNCSGDCEGAFFWHLQGASLCFCSTKTRPLRRTKTCFSLPMVAKRATDKLTL